MNFLPYFTHLFFDFSEIRYKKALKRVKSGESRNNWSSEGDNFLTSVNNTTCIYVP